MEKIIGADDSEVVLSVPRFSHISESLSNFHLLKREADALDKKILIESVDDHVIELAEMSGLKAVNPFFAKQRRQFSDIVAPKELKEFKAKKQKTSIESKEPPRVSAELKTGKTKDKEIKAIAEGLALAQAETDESRPVSDRARIKLRLGKRFLIRSGAAVILIFIAVSAIRFLPRARVTIASQIKEWEYNDSIITDKSASLDTTKMGIANQIFSQKNNAYLKFPASGKRLVEKRAAGKIIVYNSYSSDPQPLLEKTRFITPEGKVYRLTKGIIVPGAKVVEGKIVPSSIETAVVADQPGAEYNIGPVKLFTIPGFKESPKYKAFYAESTGNMTGGFIGEVAYPTADDIKNAKTNIQSTLENALDASFLVQIPREFKILDDAKKFQILEQKIDEEADDSGSFGIFTEARKAVIAFKEADLKELLEKRAKQETGEDFDIKKLNLEYGLVRADFEKGVLAFPVKAKIVLAKRINIDDLKTKLAGRSEAELRATIVALPGLENIKIDLWPFWVKKVPKSADKIKITAQ